MLPVLAAVDAAIEPCLAGQAAPLRRLERRAARSASAAPRPSPPAAASRLRRSRRRSSRRPCRSLIDVEADAALVARRAVPSSASSRWRRRRSDLIDAAARPAAVEAPRLALALIRRRVHQRLRIAADRSTRSVAPVFSSTNSVFFHVAPPSVVLNTPRSAFDPHRWPAAATYTMSGLTGIDHDAADVSASP